VGSRDVSPIDRRRNPACSCAYLTRPKKRDRGLRSRRNLVALLLPLARRDEQTSPGASRPQPGDWATAARATAARLDRLDGTGRVTIPTTPRHAGEGVHHERRQRERRDEQQRRRQQTPRASQVGAAPEDRACPGDPVPTGCCPRRARRWGVRPLAVARCTAVSRAWRSRQRRSGGDERVARPLLPPRPSDG
jgi:hypothetical protein